MSWDPKILLYNLKICVFCQKCLNLHFEMEEERKEESDNIYIYSEEEENEHIAANKYDDNMCDVTPEEDDDRDKSATNFAQCSEEEIAKANSKDPEGVKATDKTDVSIFGLLLKTMFNPVEGWKSIRRHKITPEEAQRECFYPLLAVYSISKFAILAYSSRANLSEVVVDAVTSFVSFFFGYFLIVMLLKHMLPKSVGEEFDSNFGKTLVVVSLSSLCLFFILTELLPMLWAVLIFLPLWTVYMICRATKFFKIPEDRQLMTVGLLNLIIIGMPIILEWVFGKILPN